MRIKLVFLVLVLTLFLIPVETRAQDVSIAISGPLVSGVTFDVVPGQRIESHVRVENTGLVPTSISFSPELVRGVLNGVVSTFPSDMQLLPECAAVGDIVFEVQPNASVFSEILIHVTAAGISSEDNKSVVHASACARARFRLSDHSVELHVRTLDQWNWPIPDLDISISKEHLQYTKQRTDENGSTTFILAAGLYRIRAYDNLSVLAEALLNVTRNRYFEFYIYCGLQTTTPATVHLAELVLGLGLGYFIHWFRVKRRSEELPESGGKLEWELT